MDDFKVTMLEDSPSAQLIKAAASEALVTDETGRVIKLKKPGVLAQYRLIEALGDSASNAVYVRMVLPIIYVASIDGDPVTVPSSKMQVEALIQRLDEAGISAVVEGVSVNFGQSDPDADKAALKN